MIVSSKRPKNVALFSFIISIFFFGITYLLGSRSEFFAISAVSWFILYVALIWFVLCIQFYQRSLAEREKLDLSQLAKSEQSSTIFQAKSEHEKVFAVAQGRLEILEKWFIPIFATLIAIYQIVVGLLLLKTVLSVFEGTPKEPLFCSIIMTGIAFVSFLLSRYATGMSVQKEWKPLRAGGSSMLGAALLCFALAIILALVDLFPEYMVFVLKILALVIPGLMILLGLEIALNLIMDIYRPRLKGQYSRSAFDSRLLGVFNEPGGILKSAADALDYQFGFQVSQTWFYKLLEQAIIPLILFGAISLYAMSCFVIVGPGEQAIIEFFGNPIDDSDNTRLVGSGLTLKWPWPIAKAYKYPVEKIAEITIGYVEETPEDGKFPPKIWGEKHFEEEYPLMVASKQQGVGEQENDSPGEKVPAINLVIAAVPVQYRIKDLYSFIYDHNEPEELLESICYRELTKYAVSAKLEEDEENDENNMKFLFNVESGFESNLDNGVITEDIRQKFEENNFPLTQQVSVNVEQEGLRWRINTNLSQEFPVRKENDVLNFYKMERSLLARGRDEASKVLIDRIQKAADAEGLGVEIVFLGMQGVHPPKDVAKDYQMVTGAIQEQQQLVLDAQAEKVKTLCTTAGSVEKAEVINNLRERLNDLENAEGDNTEQIEELRNQLDEAFERASGQIYKILAEAQTYAFSKKVLAEADGERFAGQLKAYKAAPEIYLYKQEMLKLEDTLKGIRKYMIVPDEINKQIIIIDLQDKLEHELSIIGDTSTQSIGQ